MNNSHLKFILKKESFAISVSQVLKFLEFKEVTPVPQAPPFLMGVINWQGSLLPVVDLNHKLGFLPTDETSETCILVIELQMESEKMILGCVVDQVKAVFNINPDDIISSPSIGEKYQSEIIRGMYPVKDQFIILLDYAKIFENDDTLHISQNELNGTVATNPDNQ